MRGPLWVRIGSVRLQDSSSQHVDGLEEPQKYKKESRVCYLPAFQYNSNKICLDFKKVNIKESEKIMEDCFNTRSGTSLLH